MKKNLLIISVSAGSGHVRAAQALHETASMSFTDVFDVTHIDMMDYLALPVKTAIKSYDVMVKQMPDVWGFLYKKSDKAQRMKHFRTLTNHINRMNATRLYEYVAQHKPDAVICTHFLPAQTLFAAPKKYGLTQPISFVMTDYDNHMLLMMNGFSRYFVATEKMKQKMIYEGMDGSLIRVTGIPVCPVFFHDYDAQELKKKYRIDATRPLLLVLSGGFGLAHTEKIVPTLCQLQTPVTIVAIAGKNPELEGALREIVAPSHIDLRIVGWTNAIHEYMAMADRIITKPGGLTTSECIALGKRIIAIQPIPGQEERNAEFLLEHGHGVVAHGAADLLYYVGKMGAETLQGSSSVSIGTKKAPTSVGATLILDEVQALLAE